MRRIPNHQDYRAPEQLCQGTASFLSTRLQYPKVRILRPERQSSTGKGVVDQQRTEMSQRLDYGWEELFRDVLRPCTFQNTVRTILDIKANRQQFC